MKTYSNAEICQMVDDGYFEDGDRLYIVPDNLEVMKVNDEFRFLLRI